MEDECKKERRKKNIAITASLTLKYTKKEKLFQTSIASDWLRNWSRQLFSIKLLSTIICSFACHQRYIRHVITLIFIIISAKSLKRSNIHFINHICIIVIENRLRLNSSIIIGNLVNCDKRKSSLNISFQWWRKEMSIKLKQTIPLLHIILNAPKMWIFVWKKMQFHQNWWSNNFAKYHPYASYF